MIEDPPCRAQHLFLAGVCSERNAGFTGHVGYVVA